LNNKETKNDNVAKPEADCLPEVKHQCASSQRLKLSLFGKPKLTQRYLCAVNESWVCSSRRNACELWWSRWWDIILIISVSYIQQVMPSGS